MRVNRRSMGTAALLCLAAMATGSPLVGKEPKKTPPISGFLGDYSELEPHPDKKNMLVYRARPGALAEYDKFIVDPVLVYFHQEAKGVGVDPRELAELSGFLHQSVVEALTEGGAYQVVEAPGPGVVRIRGAITDVVPVDPKKNLGSSVAGVVAGVGLLVPRVDLGRASVEAEFLDSESGERLVAVVAEKKGRRFGGKIKGAKTWGDAKSAFKKWSKQLRKRLDQARGE